MEGIVSEHEMKIRVFAEENEFHVQSLRKKVLASSFSSSSSLCSQQYLLVLLYVFVLFVGADIIRPSSSTVESFCWLAELTWRCNCTRILRLIKYALQKRKKYQFERINVNGIVDFREILI